MKHKGLLLALAAVCTLLIGTPAAWATIYFEAPASLNQSVDEGQTLTFTVTARTDAKKKNKPDEFANITLQAGSLPTGSTFTVASQNGATQSGTFSWTPGYNQAGAYSVKFTSKETGQVDNPDEKSITVNITVGNVNRKPVLAPISDATIDAGQTLSFSISATDPDTWDTLTYSAADMPTGATFTGQTFTWTPTNAQGGKTYNVLFKVVDNGSPQLSDEKRVAITVNNVNRPPQFTDIGSQTGLEGSELTFTVLASDPDGDPLTFAMTSGPLGANFDPATQVFSWTPGYADAGNYTATFSATDGNFTVSYDVSITVGNKNRPPRLNPIGNYTINEGETLTITVTGADDDGNELSFSTGDIPTGATFAGQTFTWTPDYNQAGVYTVTFTVTDNGTTGGNPDPLTDSETITITVGNTNRKPTLNKIGPQSGSEGVLLEFTLSASDPDGDNITFSAEGLPDGATLNGNKFSWTPGFDQAGTYEVTFFATDDGKPSVEVAQETVAITIGNVNRPPVFDSLGEISGKEGTTLSFTVIATDPDGDGINYSCSGLPSGAAFNPETRTFTWPINYGQAGNYKVTFCATDNYTEEPKSAEISAFITVAQPKPTELINSIVAYVLSLKLDKNVENSYIANLKKVEGFILKGQLTPAINQLNATIQKVDQDLKKGGLIAPEYAAQLKLMINELLGMLAK